MGRSAAGWLRDGGEGTKSGVFHHTEKICFRMELTPVCGWRGSFKVAKLFIIHLPVVVGLGKGLNDGHVSKELRSLIRVFSGVAVCVQLKSLIPLMEGVERFGSRFLD